MYQRFIGIFSVQPLDIISNYYMFLRENRLPKHIPMINIRNLSLWQPISLTFDIYFKLRQAPNNL